MNELTKTAINKGLIAAVFLVCHYETIVGYQYFSMKLSDFELTFFSFINNHLDYNYVGNAIISIVFLPVLMAFLNLALLLPFSLARFLSYFLNFFHLNLISLEQIDGFWTSLFNLPDYQLEFWAFLSLSFSCIFFSISFDTLSLLTQKVLAYKNNR